MSLSLNPYQAVVSLRNGLFNLGIISSKSLPLPVVSVGNISIGGSGKTPFVMYLAGYFKKAGKHPMILSRGYRSELEGQWGLVCSNDGNSEESIKKYGDEPVLIHESLEDIPVVIGKDRFKSAKKALEFFKQKRRQRPNLAILDDGFQHRKLNRNVDIVLWDLSEKKVDVLPFGTLREPLSSVNRADALVCIDRGVLTGVDVEKPYRPEHENSYVLSLETRFAELKSGDSVIIVSAIAKPEVLKSQAENFGLKVEKAFFYRDHHFFSKAELDEWRAAARQLNSKILITQKDEVKLRARIGPEDPFQVTSQAFKEDGQLKSLMKWLENRLHEE